MTHTPDRRSTRERLAFAFMVGVFGGMVFVGLAPNVEALADPTEWESVGNDLSNRGLGLLTQQFGQVTVFWSDGFGEFANKGIARATCNGNQLKPTPACSPFSDVDTTIDTRAFLMDTSVEGSVGMMCYSDDDFRVGFARSDNSGVSWSSFTHVIVEGVPAASVDIGQGCGIGSSGGGSHIVLSWYNKTVTSMRVYRSLDSGVTWTPLTTNIQTFGTIGACYQNVGVESLTTWVVFFSKGACSSTMSACRTTDTGVTYTCQETSGPAGMQIDWTGSEYRGTWRQGVSSANYCTSPTGFFFQCEEFGVGTGTICGNVGHVATQTERLGLWQEKGESGTTGWHVAFRPVASGGAWSNAEIASAGTFRLNPLSPETGGTRCGTGMGYSTARNELYIARNVLSDSSTCGSFCNLELEVGVRDYTPPAAGTFKKKVTLTGEANPLKGFAVDPTGTVLVTRQNPDGDTNTHIIVYDAQTLVQTGEVTDTGCNLVDLVDANQNHVAYVTCEDNNAQPKFLRVRNHALGQPAFSPSMCNWCNHNIEFEGDFELQSSGTHGSDPFRDIKNIKTPRFFADRTSPNADYAWMTWSFSTYAGEVGHAMFTAINDVPEFDQDRQTAVAVFGPSIVDDVCAFSDGDPFTTNVQNTHEYIGAVTESATTKMYRVTYNTQTKIANNGHSYELLVGDIGLHFTNSNLNDAVGIACIGRKMWVATTDLGGTTNGKIVGYDFGVSPPKHLFTTTNVDTKTDGIAVSGDGNWIAYADGTKVKIANATTGNVTSQVDIPSTGLFKGIRLDFPAANVWVASTTNITRYAVAFSTCVVGCSLVPGDGVDPVIPPGGGAPQAPAAPGEPGSAFGGVGAAIATTFSVSNQAGDIILGLLIMLLIASSLVVLGVKSGAGVGMAIGLGMIGLVGGFIFVVATSLWPTWTMFAAIMLIGGIFAMRHFG